MKSSIIIWHFIALLFALPANSQQSEQASVDFFGEKLAIPYQTSEFVEFDSELSTRSINQFYQKAIEAKLIQVADVLREFRDEKKLDDWLYYQLVRRTAQLISPKAANYQRYTLYKWFFMLHSGYDVTLSICNERILFYIQSDENIYNIPSRIRNNKQYVCLNYHDYGYIDFEKERFADVVTPVNNKNSGFTYKITRLPDFSADDYEEKELHFTYYQQEFQFKIKLNPKLKTIFANYPVLDYDFYLNIPLSKVTYESLIPLLKKQIAGMSVTGGVDYLMRFTRDAFLFETDLKKFGSEKRFTPEQTLLYEQSDCEDRAALFFYLVRETLNLPMLVLTYPNHVTVAVKLDKPVGKTIKYNGSEYSLCEPTPQRKDLGLGQVSHQLSKSPFEIVFAYAPEEKR